MGLHVCVQAAEVVWIDENMIFLCRPERARTTISKRYTAAVAVQDSAVGVNQAIAIAEIF
jgi:hypothetical protein